MEAQTDFPAMPALLLLHLTEVRFSKSSISPGFGMLSVCSLLPSRKRRQRSGLA